MSKLAPNLYGLVLTGGKSQRMGTDKALIQYHNIPHARYIYDLLCIYCDRVFLSARNGQWHNTPLATLPTITDREEELGPFGGILTALETYPSANWLVIACDLAHINSYTIEKLIDNYRDDVIAICYRQSGESFPEPLCTLYTPLAFKEFRRAYTDKIYSVVQVLQKNKCHLITPQTDKEIANINTPSAYQQACLDIQHNLTSK